MTKKLVKTWLLSCMTVVLSVLCGFGFYFLPARAEDGTISMTITGVGGGAQDAMSRYLVRLVTDVEFVYENTDMPAITVIVDGAEKQVETYNDQDEKSIALVVPYDVAPKTSKVSLTVKSGTVFHNYVIAEDATFILDNGSLVLKSDKKIRLEAEKNADDTLRGGAQDELHRYIFYFTTDQTGLHDTMWNGNTVLIDAGTDREKTAPMYCVGGAFEGDTKILAIVEYGDIVSGATVASEIGKHTITISRGAILGNEFEISEDVVLYVGNEYIALNESDIPDLPTGMFKATTGIENATIDYETTNIEDYIASADVVKLKAGAEKDKDNNIFLKSDDASLGYCKSIKIVKNDAEPKIKFRSVYTGGDIFLVLEIRSQLDGGNYWLTDGAPVVRLRYVEEYAEAATMEQCLFFDFFNNGLQDIPQYSIFYNTDFCLNKDEEFFVEFGAVNKQDVNGNDGFVFFVCVTQGENVAYGECLMTGDYNVSDSGNVTIYEAPANSSILAEGAWNQTDNDVCSFTIMSVDKQRVIDGVKTNIGAMSLYDPDITYAEGYDEYDISDLVPVQNGVTYTKIEGDTTSASQSLINAMGVSTKNGGYSVKMKIKFTGEDFGCTFAFRGKNTLAQGGYKLIIAENVVICGVMTVDSPFVSGQEYTIEIGCIDYYVASEKNASGAYVYLKVDGTLVVSDMIDKLTGLGTYFCGLIEGAGGSTLTISSTKAVSEHKAIEIATTVNKETLLNGKKATLGYTSNMQTANDKVTYEVVSGKARISGDGVYSESDYEFTVRVKVENEYGVFYGEPVVINAGKVAGGNAIGGLMEKLGCSSAVETSFIGMSFAIAALAAVVLIKKKEN